MNFKRKLLVLSFILFIGSAFAQDDHSLLSSHMQSYIGYGAIICMLLLFIVAMLVLLRALKILTRILLKSKGYTPQEIRAELKPTKVEKKPKAEIWHKLLSLKPLAEECDLIMEHEYDGIQELDNPIPSWFMYLFYGTILFAVSYLLIYHVFKIEPLQYEEYQTEVTLANAAKKVYLSKQANRVDENTVKLVADAATISSGQVIFKKTCAPCHGEHAQGIVGPNLTDDYWLHGGTINEIFKTVKYGVPSKGMPTWEKQLSPKQISDVANYIKSLRGTNPAGAKEREGIKEAENNTRVEKKELITTIIR
jgi:cytochrome c oxidase cbb3-type subunit 3